MDDAEKQYHITTLQQRIDFAQDIHDHPPDDFTDEQTAWWAQELTMLKAAMADLTGAAA